MSTCFGGRSRAEGGHGELAGRKVQPSARRAATRELFRATPWLMYRGVVMPNCTGAGYDRGPDWCPADDGVGEADLSLVSWADMSVSLGP
jgi:hypothetical protein